MAVSNYSILRRDPPATVSNTGGTVRRACHGAVDLGGFTGVVIVHDPCFWDGGGETNNWSEAANWDSDSVPTSNDRILIGNVTAPVTAAAVGTAFGLKTPGAAAVPLIVVNLDVSFDIGPSGSLTISPGHALQVGAGVTLSPADRPPGSSIRINGALNLDGGTLHNRTAG